MFKMEAKLLSPVPPSASIIHLLLPGWLENLAAPSLQRNVSHVFEPVRPSLPLGPPCTQQYKHQYENDWPRTTFLSRIHGGTFEWASHQSISLTGLR